jgi:hypothetical protein
MAADSDARARDVDRARVAGVERSGRREAAPWLPQPVRPATATYQPLPVPGSPIPQHDVPLLETETFQRVPVDPAITTPRLQQVIVTRFSERSPNNHFLTPDPDWIAYRHVVIETLTARSVRARSFAGFAWWLLCDVTSSYEQLARLRRIDPRVHIFLTGPADTPAVAPELADRIAPAWSPRLVLRPDTDILAETSPDSDDLIHREFLQDVADESPAFWTSGYPYWLRDPACGYQYEPGQQRVVEMTRPRSVFQTLYHRAAVSREPHSVRMLHGRAPQVYPGAAVYGRRCWMMVCHGGNVSNRMYKGEPVVDWDELRAGFDLPL